MIKALSFGEAVSDEGFRIKAGYKRISYFEDMHALRIAEYTTNKEPYTFIVDFNNMTGWFPPYQDEIITKEKKQQIMQRVEAALKVMLNQPGYEYQIDRKDNQLIATLKKMDRALISKNNQRQIEKSREIFRKLG